MSLPNVPSGKNHRLRFACFPDMPACDAGRHTGKNHMKKQSAVPLEIERKFLIRYPDISLLESSVEELEAAIRKAPSGGRYYAEREMSNVKDALAAIQGRHNGF